MKNVILLGATGSIGSQVLEIIKDDKNYNLYAFSFGKNINRAEEIINQFNPKIVCCMLNEHANYLQKKYQKIAFISGESGLEELAKNQVENQVFINALVGYVGMMPTLIALENNKNVLLANKESLVIGGELIISKAKKHQVKIIPIDSEHSAIFQLMNNQNMHDVRNLFITASGGAFRDKTREQLYNVTKEEALKHPNWKMGNKITIDCATLMNKGFELIEAYYLFNIDIDHIIPIIHRESIIHSMVEFNDGVIFAQMGVADMRVPIKYALEYPNHHFSNLFSKLDLTKIKKLTFEEVSIKKYPLIKYAIEALKQGKYQPTILNAANEAAVQLFLEDQIKFLDIEKIIIQSMNNQKYHIYDDEKLTSSKIINLHKLVYNDIVKNKKGV